MDISNKNSVFCGQKWLILVASRFTVENTHANTRKVFREQKVFLTKTSYFIWKKNRFLYLKMVSFVKRSSRVNILSRKVMIWEVPDSKWKKFSNFGSKIFYTWVFILSILNSRSPSFIELSVTNEFYFW